MPPRKTAVVTENNEQSVQKATPGNSALVVHGGQHTERQPSGKVVNTENNLRLLPDSSKADKIAELMQSYRTLTITSMVATFAVPNTALGGVKMFAVMRAPLYTLPQGSIVLGLWILALICLGSALANLSPSRPELGIYKRFRDEFQSISDTLRPEDRQTLHKSVEDAWAQVERIYERANKLLCCNLILIAIAIALEFMMGILTPLPP